MPQLWQGRASKAVDSRVNDFNSSIRFDARMIEQDIQGSLVHSAMLGRQGIISRQDVDDIHKGLHSILDDLHSGALEIDPNAAPQPETEKPADDATLQGVNILLAEDNDLNLEIAQFLLENAGATVTAARNGQEAVDIFAASRPGEFDAILMDVMMPVMDGYTATRTIRRLDRPDAGRIPILAMTANAFAEDRRRAYEAGMNEHLTKPLETELVIKTLAKYRK